MYTHTLGFSLNVTEPVVGKSLSDLEEQKQHLPADKNTDKSSASVPYGFLTQPWFSSIVWENIKFLHKKNYVMAVSFIFTYAMSWNTHGTIW